MHTVTLYKEASIWNYMTKYANGSGAGSCNRGTKATAVSLAISNMKAGDSYRLITNGRDEGVFTK